MTETEPPPVLHVAAAVIRREGKTLVALRNDGGPFDGLWEFPGGAIEEGETPERAVERECREELGCEVRALGVCARVRHEYPNRTIELIAVECAPRADAEPRPLASAQLAWITLEELRRRAIPEANRELIDRIEAGLGG